jgi:UDP-4-amino-4,6-dideoxy-N-acetyl-beta-L-altrosamine transaminase
MSGVPFLPYARQVVGEDDIAAVAEVLRGDWLTTGPAVGAFEAELARELDVAHAVVCNSGTAALYLALRASDLNPGDTVIVPAVTFVASASAAILAGLDVVFADVDAETGLMGVEHAEAAMRRAGGAKAVKAVIPVHLGGRVANPAGLRALAQRHGLLVIEDACHAFGTRYGSNNGLRIGSCADSDAACFSFHPVKAIAMGEGGAVTTNSDATARRLRLLRNHGMTNDPEGFANLDMAFTGGEVNPWYYEVAEISHNFRASDINCALGLSQLRKFAGFLAARRDLMRRYETRLASLAPNVRLVTGEGCDPGWHLCTVLVDFGTIGIDRRTLMLRLRARGIGTQVHYIPVHEQPYYRKRGGVIELPGASAYYERTLSLPLFPGMTNEDVDRVVDAVTDEIGKGAV